MGGVDIPTQKPTLLVGFQPERLTGMPPPYIINKFFVPVNELKPYRFSMVFHRSAARGRARFRDAKPEGSSWLPEPEDRVGHVSFAAPADPQTISDTSANG